MSRSRPAHTDLFSFPVSSSTMPSTMPLGAPFGAAISSAYNRSTSFRLEHQAPDWQALPRSPTQVRFKIELAASAAITLEPEIDEYFRGH